MLKSHIVKGQIAAVIYSQSKIYHRGEIIHKYENDIVKVFFVDYGTVDYVSVSDIKYLPKEFSMLPKQAFRGSLSHIKPLKRRWTRESICEFISMVSDILLYGRVESIEENTNSCHLSLVNTLNEKDVYINKELILRGHALKDCNWNNPKLVSLKISKMIFLNYIICF